MTQLGKHRHVVPNDPKFPHLALSETKYACKVQIYTLVTGRKWPHLSVLRTLELCPERNELVFSQEPLQYDRLVRKCLTGPRIETFELLEALDRDLRRGLAVPHKVRSDVLIERVIVRRV